MKSDDIKQLLKKYFEGETSLAEEEILRTYFKEGDIPEDLYSYKDHFCFLGDLNESVPVDMPDDEALFEKIEVAKMPSRSIGSSASSLPWFRYAAGIALLALGFTAGWLMGNGETESAQIAGTEKSEAGQNSVILTGLNDKTSASERIRAINDSRELNDLDQEVAQALIRTMNYDDNTNVRLAAVEALSYYTNREDVRKSLIQSLEIQDHPLIQIALIDLLVNMEEKRAIHEIKKLMIDENTQEIVRKRAEVGVALLM